MKPKKLITALIVLAILTAVAMVAWNRFGKQTGGDITPTPIATATVAPTEGAEPTAEPTVEPTKEPTPTAEPTATNTPVPTAEPTEPPHEHMWKKIEVYATCTIEGAAWEECECGERQNEIVINALGHGDLIRVVAKHPTVEEEGEYVEICSVCGEEVEKGSIAKLEPTPTPTAVPEPTATPTPKPTNTPTPTPSPKPTSTPKPTATPTPKPTSTPTPIPVTPTPIPVVVDSYTSPGDRTFYVLEDGTKYEDVTKEVQESITYAGKEYIYYKAQFTADGMPTGIDEFLIKYDKEIDCNGKMLHLTYYMYTYQDVYKNDDTGNYVGFSRIVNSDGSYNKYSAYTLPADANCRSSQCGYVDVTGNYDYKYQLMHLGFGRGYDESKMLILYPEDLIYYNKETGEIRLYDH